MKGPPLLQSLIAFLRPDSQADRVVPPSGHNAWLTSFTAGAMTFLCVFALSLSLAAGRLADRWADSLAGTATIRILAPEDQMKAQTDAVLAILENTPGITRVHVLGDEENRALLEPWLGADLPIEELSLPRLIELEENGNGYDAEALRQRLADEAPGAVLDDHTRWRRPLIEAASRLRLLALLSIGLIGASLAGVITLAAGASLAANGQVIEILRQVGAEDGYIARAFVRRFTLRAFLGASVGALAGTGAVLLLPGAAAEGGFLTGLGFAGRGWIWPFVLPVIAGIVAFAATRHATMRKLRESK